MVSATKKRTVNNYLYGKASSPQSHPQNIRGHDKTVMEYVGEMSIITTYSDLRLR